MSTRLQKRDFIGKEKDYLRYLSVFNDDGDILTAFSDIFLNGDWYDLDCTYSKGVFYAKTRQPKKKSDLIPFDDSVIQSDSRSLDWVEDNSIKSIVFDPPFLFRNRVAANNDKMCARFSYFKSFEELQDMYRGSLKAILSKLSKRGYLFFKCQDMTDGKFFCTHNWVINEAESMGYTLKDIAIKATTKKLQRDAKQQNCVAKVHSYWLVFQK